MTKKNIMADGFEPKTRNQIIDFWHQSYGFNKDIIRVAMGIIEATQSDPDTGEWCDFTGWHLQGAQEDSIQSFCRILQKMGPSDPKEPFDFRRIWEETA